MKPYYNYVHDQMRGKKQRHKINEGSILLSEKYEIKRKMYSTVGVMS